MPLLQPPSEWTCAVSGVTYPASVPAFTRVHDPTQPGYNGYVHRNSRFGMDAFRPVMNAEGDEVLALQRDTINRVGHDGHNVRVLSTDPAETCSICTSRCIPGATLPTMDDTGTRTGPMACFNCRARHEFTCNACGFTFHSSVMTGRGTCRACGRFQIHNAKRKPTPIFHHTTFVRSSLNTTERFGLYFGAEIEQEFPRSTECVRAARTVLSAVSPEFMHAEHDGSLHHGIEFVTMPFSLEWMQGAGSPMIDSLGEALLGCTST